MAAVYIHQKRLNISLCWCNKMAEAFTADSCTTWDCPFGKNILVQTAPQNPKYCTWNVATSLYRWILLAFIRLGTPKKIKKARKDGTPRRALPKMMSNRSLKINSEPHRRQWRIGKKNIPCQLLYWDLDFVQMPGFGDCATWDILVEVEGQPNAMIHHGVCSGCNNKSEEWPMKKEDKGDLPGQHENLCWPEQSIMKWGVSTFDDSKW